MRFGGRVAAAIEILGTMATQHRPAGAVLKDWGSAHRFAGSGDRAAIGTIVHDALRRRRSAAFLMGDDGARAQALGALILEWGHSPEFLNASFAGDHFAPEPLSGAEQSAIASNSPGNAPDAVRADCPDWCAPHFNEAFGTSWVAEIAALAKRPPLDIRVNTLKSTPEKVLRALDRQGAFQCDLTANALRIAPTEGAGRHPNVQAETAFQKGQFEIQDAGSQIVSELTGAGAGEQVLDYCAGAGGKTLALSAMMENRGQVFAHDLDKQRLAPMFERIKRAGCRNVQAINGPDDLVRLRSNADLVLVDAPCTGSGTWRRRPDAKWRLTGAQLEKRQSEQAMILAEAANYVKPGGRLAYVTCSLFPGENTGQIRHFLASRHDFENCDYLDILERNAPMVSDRCRTGEYGITLSPHQTGTDGFFFAMMTRLQGTV